MIRTVFLSIALLVAAALGGCAGMFQSTLAKTTVRGDGVFATNLDTIILVVRGEAGAGVYYKTPMGEFPITDPSIANRTADALRLVVLSENFDESYPLDEPLPGEVRERVEAFLTPEEIERFGIVFAPEPEPETAHEVEVVP